MLVTEMELELQVCENIRSSGGILNGVIQLAGEFKEHMSKFR